MKKVIMPEMVSNKKYRIAGGWVLDVPTFSAESDYVRALTGQLLPILAYDQRKAETEAVRRIDELCRNTFIDVVREFTRRMADEYARRFPARIRQDKTLDGFDPALAAQYYQPYRKPKGRDGDPLIAQLMRKMASAPLTRIPGAGASESEAA